MTHEQKPLSARKLSKSERRWIEGVQRAIDDRPPKNLGFYATGDRDIHIYDNNKEEEIEKIVSDVNGDLMTNNLIEAIKDTNARFHLTIKFPTTIDHL